MANQPRNPATDLLGVSSLSLEAIAGITDIVESLHNTIKGISQENSDSLPTSNRSISGMVFKNIRSVTEIVGSGIDALLAKLGSRFGDKDSSVEREAVLSALNGLLGDHLQARDNPLAISMQLRQKGKPFSQPALLKTMGTPESVLLIMVHGSCMNDLQWNRQGHDHGAALERDMGMTPLYVHYNTGLHISENGRTLSDLLEKVVIQAPPQLKICMIAHSMGGLVTRSALHYGLKSGHTWSGRVQKVVFLGTPHHGAPLEKGGNWVDTLLGLNPYSAPFSRLGKIRSAGITDLRYGNVLDEDWAGRDRFEFSGDQRTPVPLPRGVRCYTVAATTGKRSNRLRDTLIGDGLVTVSSALGGHKKPEMNLNFPEAHQWIGRNMNHLDLLNNREVYEIVREWLNTNGT